ncbi:MAG: hypothetical protein IKM75_09425 [Bacteroidales bacterium]|nr:hypothetical protein [Bacteroidales bacterium]
MTSWIKGILVTLLLCFLSQILFSQEKTQSYYNSHETEILPDAKMAFQNGKYERAEELCRWHYIIVGDNAADALRKMAERCAQLSTEMVALRTVGKIKEAKEVANTLLSINPNDVAAKKMLEELEEPELPIFVDTLVVDVPMNQDSVMTVTHETEERPVEEPAQESVSTTIVEQKEDPIPNVPNTKSPIHKPFIPKTMFVVKAGASFLSLEKIAQSVAPGGSLGIYNLGGSRIGLEVGGYLCPSLLSLGSLFGMDASFVLRVTKSVYPKLGVGYFSYKQKSESGSATQGLCAGGGLTFLFGGHFCLEFGAKYYPEIRSQGVETVSTTPGSTYEFPTVAHILSAGISPFVSIGWAF